MDKKTLVHIAVFGSLWGIAEATIGSTLHLLHLPLSGAILASIGLGIILIARTRIDANGSAILMALIAASIKLLSFASIKLGPFIAIIMEGACVEIILIIFKPGRMGFLLSGIFVSIYPILQNIVTKSILFGSNFVAVILDLADGFSQKIGFNAGWWVLSLYVAAHFLITFSVVGFAWQLKKKLVNPKL